jgi:hypothetical protein
MVLRAVFCYALRESWILCGSSSSGWLVRCDLMSLRRIRNQLLLIAGWMDVNVFGLIPKTILLGFGENSRRST